MISKTLGEVGFRSEADGWAAKFGTVEFEIVGNESGPFRAAARERGAGCTGLEGTAKRLKEYLVRETTKPKNAWPSTIDPDFRRAVHEAGVQKLDDWNLGTMRFTSAVDRTFEAYFLFKEEHYLLWTVDVVRGEPVGFHCAAW